MDQVLEDWKDYLQDAASSMIQGFELNFNELTLISDLENIRELLVFLRNDPQCKCINFIDLSGVDYPEREHRFDVVYHLMSPQHNLRVRIKILTDEETPVPSIVDIFPGATWFEREAYDLYGIIFTGHPDLRRLLTDYGFDGYPLRKDFPVTGFSEVRYDDERKRVVYEPVKLVQEFRQFDFISPWEGAEYVLPGDEKADE